ncbi:hypothetical protein ACIP68_21580 [Streptomyces griseoviridis]|uniref:hypothetical protein n=1 Tax=Streptomyces griseoviridis TaxID=45398 RepID=UPI0033DC4C95
MGMKDQFQQKADELKDRAERTGQRGDEAQERARHQEQGQGQAQRQGQAQGQGQGQAQRQGQDARESGRPHREDDGQQIRDRRPERAAGA